MFVALLDTSVLWPSLQRDFLLSLAIERVYRPVWSEAILSELEFHEALKLQKRRTEASEAQARAAHLVGQMRKTFSDAVVTGWEPLEGSYGLPDPDDEHVVAAAQIAGAGVIVTANLKDFPLTLLPDGIEAIPVAEFARDAVSLSPTRSLDAITQMAIRTGRTGPQLTELDIVEVLEQRYAMTDAMAMIRAELAS
ncbi:MAG: PIN domain-containing protein [Pseudolysinimonas sp.]|jgi:predicted nucleic acid-binding protein|uniref:PIN domain-containing protein n=1 Tax=Pseudolysinimonas sp. TaxID=2680009 RepID=UPI003C7771DA